jgi:hypothetical protein
MANSDVTKNAVKAIRIAIINKFIRTISLLTNVRLSPPRTISLVLLFPILHLLLYYGILLKVQIYMKKAAQGLAYC